MKKNIKFNASKKPLKISLIVLMVLSYLYVFIEKLYLFENNFCITRIIFPIICILLFSLGLFYKYDNKLSDKKNFIVSVVVSILFIIFNLFIIQYGQGFNALIILGFKWKIFILNLITIGLLFLILFCISNNFKFSIIAMNFITLFFIIVEYYVFKLRGVGFAAGDIFSLNAAMNVASSYTYELNYEVYISIIIMITLVPFILNLGKNNFFKGIKRLIPICVTVLLLSIFCYGLTMERVDKKLRVKYFKTQNTYKKKGFPISFVKSIKDLIIIKPEGYSVENVNKILSKYESDKKGKTKGPNIIVVMNEAFTDFTNITDLKVNKDPLPFIHSLEENTVKGDLYTSVFGGGTSNTEFEVLTSNTMAFLPLNVNPYRIYIKDKYPNLNYTLKDQGYNAYAIHPYLPNGYSRNVVYPLLGFDKFVSLADFKKPTYRGYYISDDTDYKKIIEEYEKYKKKNDGPFYTYNITMQNHSPFRVGTFKEGIKLKYDKSYPEAEEYVNRLKITDDATKKLIEYFEKKDEKTIVVFFGDHEPRAEHEFYDEIGKNYTKPKEYDNFKKYNSMFFIWANYDIKEKKDIKISTNYLSNLILDTAGLNKTGYNKYISNLREEVPVLTYEGYVGKNGKYYNFTNKKSPYYKLIKDYKIIEYNNLFDTKNRPNKYYYLK